MIQPKQEKHRLHMRIGFWNGVMKQNPLKEKEAKAQIATLENELRGLPIK
jgi:hypothetical protein